MTEAAAASGRAVAAWAMWFLSDAHGASGSRSPRSWRCLGRPAGTGGRPGQRNGRADPRGRRSRRSVRPLPRRDPACRGPDGVRRHGARRPERPAARGPRRGRPRAEPSVPAQVALLSDWVQPRRQPRGHAPRPALAPCWGWAPAPASWPRATSASTRACRRAPASPAPTMQFHGVADLWSRRGAARWRRCTPTPARRPPRRRSRCAPWARRAARPPPSPTTSHGPWSRRGRATSRGRGRSARPERPDPLARPVLPPDWVDFDRIRIPQADEQQRLLANLITHMNLDRTPLPRLWYLPRGEKAAVVLTATTTATAAPPASSTRSPPRARRAARWPTGNACGRRRTSIPAGR